MAFPLGSPAPLPAKEGQTNHKRGRHSSKGGRAPSVVNDKQEVGPEKRYVSTRIAKVVGLNPTRVICRDIFFKGLGGGGGK